MDSLTLYDQLSYVTVRIECYGSNRVGTGTGFIYSVEAEGDGQLVFLVTNKHVIGDFENGKIFFTKSDGERPLVGQRVDVELRELQRLWIGHPDPNIDITVMPLGNIWNHLEERGNTPFIKSIDSSFIPAGQELADLDGLEEIIFIGYPNGIYDKVNLRPIMRRGITATAINIDYEGTPTFLIDASVFGGSSGSPVFIYNKLGYSVRRNFILDSRILFLGVVASVFYRPELGKITLRDIPTGMQPVAETKQMIDLGCVFKARTVDETIDYFRSQEYRYPVVLSS